MGRKDNLVLATLIVLVAYAIGLCIGLLGAYSGGWFDALVTRTLMSSSRFQASWSSS